MGKVTRRLISLLLPACIAGSLDRVNVGFAAITMNHDLGLSAAAFGLGAGLFFVTYFFCGLPSNLILARVGARRWIALLMVLWAIVSGSTAFVTDAHGFYALRLTLGAAEAGFFPGVLYYLTLWVPPAWRARLIALFMAGISAASLIGAPLSGLLLALDGSLGLRGWQWLFLAEAAPSLLLGLAILRALPDRPENAPWLSAEERAWLAERLRADRPPRRLEHDSALWRVLANPLVLALSFIWFCTGFVYYALSFFLPLIVHGFGLGPLATGFVSAIPFGCGLAGMALLSRRSDRSGARSRYLALAMAIAAAGVIGSTGFASPTWRIALLAVAGFGIFAMGPLFWTLPSALLRGRAAAAGMAVISAIGNLSGLIGPTTMGLIQDRTGSSAAGLIAFGLIALVGGGAALVLGDGAREAATAARG